MNEWEFVKHAADGSGREFHTRKFSDGRVANVYQFADYWRWYVFTENGEESSATGTAATLDEAKAAVDTAG